MFVHAAAIYVIRNYIIVRIKIYTLFQAKYYLKDICSVLLCCMYIVIQDSTIYTDIAIEHANTVRDSICQLQMYKCRVKHCMENTSNNYSLLTVHYYVTVLCLCFHFLRRQLAHLSFIAFTSVLVTVAYFICTNPAVNIRVQCMIHNVGEGVLICYNESLNSLMHADRMSLSRASLFLLPKALDLASTSWLKKTFSKFLINLVALPELCWTASSN